MSYREEGLFTWVGCVLLLFTGVIFTVHSVTDGVLGVLTEEETVAVSAVDVPACPIFPMGCSNMGSVGLDSRYSSELNLS